MEIVAQIAGYLGTAMIFLTYVSKKRRGILLCKLSADILWTTHYILIGAYSGAALNGIAIGRELVFYNKAKKWASSRIWLFLFLAITVCSCILTWEGPTSLLPMIGSLCAVVSFWCSNPFHIRLLALPVMVLWLIYGALHGSVPTLINNSLSLIAIIIGLIGDVRGMKMEASSRAAG